MPCGQPLRGSSTGAGFATPENFVAARHLKCHLRECHCSNHSMKRTSDSIITTCRGIFLSSNDRCRLLEQPKPCSVAARLEAPRDAHSILYSTLWGSRIYSSTFTDAASSLDWRGVNHARERDVGRHLVPSPDVDFWSSQNHGSVTACTPPITAKARVSPRSPFINR